MHAVSSRCPDVENDIRAGGVRRLHTQHKPVQGRQSTHHKEIQKESKTEAPVCGFKENLRENHESHTMFFSVSTACVYHILHWSENYKKYRKFMSGQSDI